MNIELVDVLECPKCRGELKLKYNKLLQCVVCNSDYIIKDGIPRFVQLENYADSFGFEWDIHSRTQIDSLNGTTISRDRFFNETGWPDKMHGQRILEAGFGSGRFTEIALSTGAEVSTFDLSQAVEIAVRNCNNSPKLHTVQDFL